MYRLCLPCKLLQLLDQYRILSKEIGFNGCTSSGIRFGHFSPVFGIYRTQRGVVCCPVSHVMGFEKKKTCPARNGPKVRLLSEYCAVCSPWHLIAPAYSIASSSINGKCVICHLLLICVRLRDSGESLGGTDKRIPTNQAPSYMHTYTILRVMCLKGIQHAAPTQPRAVHQQLGTGSKTAQPARWISVALKRGSYIVGAKKKRKRKEKEKKNVYVRKYIKTYKALGRMTFHGDPIISSGGGGALSLFLLCCNQPLFFFFFFFYSDPILFIHTPSPGYAVTITRSFLPSARRCREPHFHHQPVRISPRFAMPIQI